MMQVLWTINLLCAGFNLYMASRHPVMSSPWGLNSLAALVNFLVAYPHIKMILEL
jgi:hypothetical protein